MYRSGVEIPKVSFSSLQYDRIPINSYFLGFNLDNAGKLSKLERNGTITPIEFNGNFLEIQSDSIQLTSAASLINFTGSGVTATSNGSEITIDIPTPPSGISLTDLSVTAPLVYNNLTGAFSIQTATTSQLGVVKIGSGISVAPDGTISALAGGSVTSVGIQIGTTGGDVHVLNSPITSSGSINLNIPTAAPGIRGALSGTDWVTFNNKISPTRLISTTSPLSGGGDLSADRTLSISQADGSTPGYLSNADWTTFNNKVSTTRSISTTAPLSGGGDLSADRTLSISQADGSTPGYLSSGDWTTFNNKIGGSGTLNYVARFTANKTIDIGLIQDNTTSVGINSSPASDSMLNIIAADQQEYGLKITNSPFGGNALGSSGIRFDISNAVGPATGGEIIVSSVASGDAKGLDVQSTASFSQTAIGISILATGGSNNYSLQLQDGTETQAGGKFLKDTGDGKANWAEINFDLMETLTRPQIAALITSNSLIPGKWYRHQYSILNHVNGGIDSYYDIVLLATSSNTLSSRGHRIMKVPKYQLYLGQMYDSRQEYYVDDIAVYGNLVYKCISNTNDHLSSPAYDISLNSTYFQVLNPLTQNLYYTTEIYDIIFNWDYENNGPNDDWQYSEDRIVVQSDDKGNVIRRSNELSGWVYIDSQQSLIDVHEWNNNSIRNNDCFGIWNNVSYASYGIQSNSIENNRLAKKTLYGFDPEGGVGVIYKNLVNKIEDNRGGSIWKNDLLLISRNDCDIIKLNSNFQSGQMKILSNAVFMISSNSIYGDIAANRGIYVSEGQVCKIAGNVGLFESGIIDNEILGGGSIADNNIDISISSNSVYRIINNGQINGPSGASWIKHNSGKCIISYNNLVGGERVIEGNVIPYSYNQGNPYSQENIFGIVDNSCESIKYNNLLEGGNGIYNNSNEGEIKANRVITGIWNNSSLVQHISYNDAYSIQNNS